jgi:HlyD family secretion protein
MHVQRKYLIGGGVTLVAIAALVPLLRPSAVEVETGLVREGAMAVTVDADGRTRVRDRYVIRAPVAGRVARLALVEGAAVRAGDVVARIAPQPLDRAATEQARARLDAATTLTRDAAGRVTLAAATRERQQRELDRARRLLGAGAIAPRDAEAAQLAAQSAASDHATALERAQAAEADVRQARAALLALGDGDQAEVAVRAPAAGQVLLVPERSERVVAPGTPLMDVGDPRRLEVVVDVLSADAATICAGDRVRFGGFAGGAGGDEAAAPLAGRVRLVEPSAFTKVSALGVDEQRVNVIIDLDRVPPALGDGFRLEAHVITWQTPKATVAPVSALVRDGDRWSVFVVRGGRARARPLALGHINGTSAEVLSGLAAGDTVVLFPSDRIRDGARVKPQ